jgi:hypothetical protein
MNFISKAKVSPKGKFNKEDLKKMVSNAIVFIAPALVIYLAQVQGVLDSGSFEFSDLLPSRLTQGAVWSWFMSTVIDAIKKLSDGPKK